MRIVLAGVVIADSARALRVLETSHPPAYYLPPSDIRLGVLSENADRSWCEWKGEASYLDVTVGTGREHRAAWRYDHPAKPYSALAGFVAFYAQRMDACFVGDEQVTAQPGEFYGGWVTSWIVGPFKGEPGSWVW